MSSWSPLILSDRLVLIRFVVAVTTPPTMGQVATKQVQTVNIQW